MTTKAKTDDQVRVLKSATCKSLSGTATLSYQFGLQGEADLAMRLAQSTGGGFFNQDWVPLVRVQKVLQRKTGDNRVTSLSLRPIFEGKSVNSAGFLLAALLNEGAVRPVAGLDRRYEVGDVEAFVSRVQALGQGPGQAIRPKKAAPAFKQVTSKVTPAAKKVAAQKPAKKG